MPLSPSEPCRFCRRPALFALAVVCLPVFLLAAPRAFAQQQESGLLDRVNHPDRTLAFPLQDKNFSRTTSFKNKEAYVKPFIAKGATVAAGDGSFPARTFGGVSAFKAKDFAVRESSAAQRSFGQNNKLFNTDSFDVRTARDANREAPVRAYDLHDPFAIKGKRQDTYDDLLKRKKLSIDEVRELLNKNQ